MLTPQQDIYAEESQAPAVSPVNQFWQDLWRTGDQQGIAALQHGDAQTAANVFNDPAWKGSANYLGGNFPQAAEIFKNLETADSQYNLGNALARQNQFQEAIAAYEQALEADPDNEDASFNKELLEKLMQEQPQQNQDQQQQDDQKSDSDGSQQSDQQKGEGEQEDSESQQNEQQQSDQEQQGEDQAQQQQDEQESGDTEPEEQQGEDEEQQPAEQQVADAKESELDEEAKQALEQWLRRVPDDPGGLLRRKFEYQTQQRKQQGQGKFTDRDAVW
jgi:Ca-activated chloride channel family protein